LIPFIGVLFSILGLAGIIAILVSLYFFSKIYAEPGIFRNALIAIIIAVVVFIIVVPLFALLGFALGAASAITDDAISGAFIGTIGTILGIVIAILIALPAAAISAFFWYRALNTFSRASGEGLFRLAGLLYAISVLLFAIGVITSIILIGFLFSLLGGIAALASFGALAIAFYNLKQPQQTPPQPAMPAAPA